HYRSTLDFSNEALQAAEKGLRRLMEAYEWLKELQIGSHEPEREAQDKELETRCTQLLAELDGFMNDDFNTAKVLANLFELVPVINSLKDKSIAIKALATETMQQLQQKMKIFIEDILGLKNELSAEDGQLKGVIEILLDLRKEARAKKDWVTSDRIRNQLQQLGIAVKDEKDGSMSWSLTGT
ncbi:MAG: cysteine--tRNA ligase, partial [Flavisolibacter sp.]|nr:cysteine--tRNA ligase [Flavisolibacter sp.]